jgi:hypothetical protein
MSAFPHLMFSSFLQFWTVDGIHKPVDFDWQKGIFTRHFFSCVHLNGVTSPFACCIGAKSGWLSCASHIQQSIHLWAIRKCHTSALSSIRALAIFPNLTLPFSFYSSEARRDRRTEGRKYRFADSFNWYIIAPGIAVSCYESVHSRPHMQVRSGLVGRGELLYSWGSEPIRAEHSHGMIHDPCSGRHNRRLW